MNDLPVIKAFIHKDKYYIYDARCNSIFKIDKNHYCEIQQLMKVGIAAYIANSKQTQHYKDVVNLIKNNRINEPVIQSINHFYDRHMINICNRCISELQLQVTRDCNFHCRYCVHTRKSGIGRLHEKINMNWDVAKASIDFLFEHSYDSIELFINFYGGEPLINFEIIRKTVEYAEKKFVFKKVNYTVITNGSIMTDEIIQFLIKHDFLLIISFDGDQVIQNNHRKIGTNYSDTYQIVYNNIQRIKSTSLEFFDRNVKFNSVIFADESRERVFKYFERDIGKDRAFVNIINADLQGIDYFYSKVNLSDNKANTAFLYDNMEQTLGIFRDAYNDKRMITAKWFHKANCIPGAQHLLVNTYGDFYPCEKIIESAETKIGDVEHGFDFERIRVLLNIHEMTEQECKKCWAIRYCKMCICHCFDPVAEKISKETKHRNCILTQKDTLEMLKRIVESSEINE